MYNYIKTQILSIYHQTFNPKQVAVLSCLVAAAKAGNYAAAGLGYAGALAAPAYAGYGYGLNAYGYHGAYGYGAPVAAYHGAYAIPAVTKA